MTQYPLRSVLHSLDTSQRVMKWALELGQYSLAYQPRTAIKPQLLADFIAEFTPSLKAAATQPESTPEVTEHAITIHAPPDRDFWHLPVDGSSNHQGSGAGLVLTTSDNSMLEEVITLSFKSSNNEAEYEALLVGLRFANRNLVVKCNIFRFPTDHQPNLKGVHSKASKDGPIPRKENAHVDALASLGSTLDHQLRRFIPVEYLEKPNIDEELAVKVAKISTAPSWQDPIIDYIVNGTLPANKLQSRKLQMKATRYYMWNGMLIRRSFPGPHLCCLLPLNDLKILSSIHEGICGNHSGGCSFVQKALNTSHYWPTMHQDAREYAQRCDSCQCFKLMPSLPANELYPQTSS
ncbi:uncharacterized protein [Pyrus communis]|uniref:uncharacterized protein n=1 Tax=Pyrus communis TaxID=23211 RepID=UPI0035C08EFE